MEDHKIEITVKSKLIFIATIQKDNITSTDLGHGSDNCIYN